MGIQEHEAALNTDVDYPMTMLSFLCVPISGQSLGIIRGWH
jgi:hypothetical protein